MFQFPSPLAQGPETIWGYLFNILFFAFFILYLLYGQRLQSFIWIRQIEKAVIQLKNMSDKGKEITINNVKQYNLDQDPTEQILETMEFFIIPPVDIDPAGVLNRLEHLLDVRKSRFEDFVSTIAPNTSSSEASTLENLLEANMAVFLVFRIVRHFLILGKKTKSMLMIMQIHMQLPLIMRLAKAFFNALKAFADAKPIGDGIGPLVVSRLARGEFKKEIAKDIVVAEKEIEGRNAIIVKAKGPGGTVGKPGEAIKKIVQEKTEKVTRIIMIDAALRLEGEESGSVAEGVGAAIGDPGPEKYKIEESTLAKGIPVDAIIIKESIEEALTPIRQKITNSVDSVIERIKRTLRTKTNPGDTVIIAGIGNTIGIGQ